jgi:hypothetical protein
VLFKHGLTAAIIRPEDRRVYLDALQHADEGDFNSLVQLVGQRVLATFDLYLSELRKDEELTKFACEIAGEFDARQTDERKIQYMRWQRRMTQLRNEFELCAARISEQSKEIQIQVRPYDIIDQVRWENLRSGIAVEKTWYFVVSLSRRSTRDRYFFFFGKHYWSDLDDDLERSEPCVSLLVSKDDGPGHGVRLDQAEAASPVTLREIFAVNDGFTVKRFDRDSGQIVYDRCVAPMGIAMRFIREALLSELS